MPITIPFSERKAGPYTATAGQTEFSFGFPVLADADLTVMRDRAGVIAVLTLGANYTVAGVGAQNGGQVVLTAGALAGDIIEIDGTLTPERASAFVGGVPFKTAFIDNDLNRLAIMAQELNRESGRAIRRSPLDAAAGSLLLPMDVSETTLLALNAAGDVVGLLPVNLNIAAVTPLAANLLNDATAAEARATLGAASASDLYSIKGTFGAVGDGATNDTPAVTAADADPKAKFLPDGIYDTTISQAALVGPYWGHGQIRDSDNNLRGPWFSAIGAPPSSLADTGNILTAFNGDLSKVQIAMEHRITGATTLGQPTGSEYQADAETSAIYLSVFNSSGHNDATGGNGGRTAAVPFRLQMAQAGQGDMLGFYVNGSVQGAKPGATHFLANPAISIFGSAFFAANSGVFLNPAETQMHDNGFDVAGIGWNMVANRTNATGALVAAWTGFRVHSIGSADINSAFSASGKVDCGLDFSMLDTDVNFAAIALVANDRIYGNAASSNGLFATSLGDDWMEFNSGINAWNFVNGNSSQFQIYSNQVVTIPLALFQSNVVVNHTAAAVLAPGITPRLQVHGADGSTSSIGQARYSAGATGPQHIFAKSRNAVVGSHTIVQVNDTLGILNFNGSDGTNFITAATIEARCNGTPGTNDMPGALVFSTTPDGAATPTEALRIDSAQQLQFAAASFTANGASAVTITSLRPAAAANATIARWLTIKDEAGVDSYIPVWQ